jgi:hypothetical protein
VQGRRCLTASARECAPRPVGSAGLVLRSVHPDAGRQQPRQRPLRLQSKVEIRIELQDPHQIPSCQSAGSNPRTLRPRTAPSTARDVTPVAPVSLPGPRARELYGGWPAFRSAGPCQDQSRLAPRGGSAPQCGRSRYHESGRSPGTACGRTATEKLRRRTAGLPEVRRRERRQRQLAPWQTGSSLSVGPSRAHTKVINIHSEGPRRGSRRAS